MTSLFFGVLSNQGVPSDEKTVRSTAGVYERDAAPAVQSNSPERNEIETDGNPNLAGLVNRQKASHWIPSIKYPPFWKGEVDQQWEHNQIIDSQVSSSGTAAGREAAGEFGHGTMPAAIGIEPVSDLVDGGRMGNEYFVRHKRNIQATSDNTMMEPTEDRAIAAGVAALGKNEARRAAMAGTYTAWFEGNR